MPLDATALSAEADILVADVGLMRLHSADPGTGNSNPTTAADQAVSLVNDGSGNLSVGSTPFTGGAANGACTWVTLWDAGGSTRYGKFQIPVDQDQAFNAAGEYTVDSLTLTASST